MLFRDLTSCRYDQINGYSHVYSLNGYTLPTDKETYYKYMPLSYLEQEYQLGETTFVSPHLWSDSFERRFLGLDYQKIGFTEPLLHCMCLTSKQAQNEDAMWKVYARPNEAIIKAQVNIYDLLHCLDNCAKIQSFRIYIGEAIYVEKNVINSIKSNDKLFFPSQFTLANYLSLMCLKRISYMYENEVRIFIVKDNPDFLNQTRDILKIQIGAPRSLPHIETIFLAPFDELTLTERVLLETDEAKRKEIVSKAFGGIKIKQSRLNQKCLPLKL